MFGFWFLGIFLPGTSTQCAVTFLALHLTYETLHLYVCSHRVRLIYSYNPTTAVLDAYSCTTVLALSASSSAGRDYFY